MKNYRLFFFIFLISEVISFCSGNPDKKVSSAAGSGKNLNDSIAQSEESAYRDCNDPFFSSGSTTVDTATLSLTLKDGHQLSWKAFVNEELMSSQVRWRLIDLDADAAPELVVFNYTGGAHCCNEIYVFKKNGKQFTQQAKLFSGFSCVDPSGNIFTFSFTEPLGYFYGCYACGFTDSSGEYKQLREIELRYHNNRFSVVPYHPDIEKQLYRNLAILSRHHYEEMEEGLMDSGWRKEFAMNFAVWHYNHGKNWESTKALFDKYYTFKDAANVWSAFQKTLKEMEAENDF